MHINEEELARIMAIIIGELKTKNELTAIKAMESAKLVSTSIAAGIFLALQSAGKTKGWEQRAAHRTIETMCEIYPHSIYAALNGKN